MTGRQLKLSATVAAAAALLAIAVRPLVPAVVARPVPEATSVVPAPAAAVTAALETARAALGCRRAHRLLRACGELTVEGADAYRTSPRRVVVLLVGTLHDRSGGSVPVAVRVLLTPVGGGGGWRGEVALP